MSDISKCYVCPRTVCSAPWRQKRRSAGYTLHEAAMRMNIKTTRLSDIELGHESPTENEQWAMSELYGAQKVL